MRQRPKSADSAKGVARVLKFAILRAPIIGIADHGADKENQALIQPASARRAEAAVKLVEAKAILARNLTAGNAASARAP